MAAGTTRLRCPSLNLTLELPWWPTDVSKVSSGWSVTELERSGREPLAVLSALTVPEWSLGFTLRNEDYYASVAPLVADLERLAVSEKPCQLHFGEQAAGLYRLEPPQLTFTAFAGDGSPSVVDVSLVLKRASESSVNVGPVKIRGRGRRMAG